MRPSLNSPYFVLSLCFALSSLSSLIENCVSLRRPTYETAKNDEESLTSGAADDDVLNAFNVADFDDDFWQSTVPQEEQDAARKANDEEKKVKEPTVRGARLKSTNYAESNLAKARGGSDDEYSDEEYGGGGGGGGKKGKQKDLAPPGGLTEKNRKKFIHVFRKFGVVDRITAILKDPSLASDHIEETDVPELETLAKSLIQACKDRKEQMRSTPSENAHLAAPRDPNVPFCGLKVNAIDLLQVIVAFQMFCQYCALPLLTACSSCSCLSYHLCSC